MYPQLTPAQPTYKNGKVPQKIKPAMAQITSSAPDGGPNDKTFVDIQGGHQLVGGSHGTHTQDFVYSTSWGIPLAANVRTGKSNITFRLSDLGNRINQATLWQTYKVNKISYWVYWAGYTVDLTTINAIDHSPGNLALSIAPYSRSPFSSTSAEQNIDARSIPGCTTRFMPTKFQVPHIYGISTTANTQDSIKHMSYFLQAQIGAHQQLHMVEVTNTNPMYEVSSVRGQTNTFNGAQYANANLALNTARGRDNTEWFALLVNVNMFANPPTITVANFNVLIKVNITFEGLRWAGSQLFDQEPGYALGYDSAPRRPINERLHQTDEHDGEHVPQLSYAAYAR